ncbi:phosphotransferase [Nocardia callitridis]|uniref:Aminoglycoside phosphotransferase family protein n=1 Tax=Nocardia callitridis TaxID=648753 RepID=A0ABP9KF98_9NOCA
MVEDVPLPGGFVNPTVKRGDRVVRRCPARAEFVHSLLDFFEQMGWRGAPRFLGTEAPDREILSYVAGYVAWEPDRVAAVRSDAALVDLARLVRQFHDLTATHPLRGAGEVVCHNDLSPKNTVYSGTGDALRPIAFIDWDAAAPGRRIHDLAHVCWQYLELGPSVDDVAEAGGRMRLICDAYGLRVRDELRYELLDTVLWWQSRCARGIETGAAAGEPGMRELCLSGVPEVIRTAHRWVVDHRAALERAL